MHVIFQGIKTPLEMFAGTQCEFFCENCEFTKATTPRRGQNLASMHQSIIQPSTMSEQIALTAALSHSLWEAKSPRDP